MLSCCDYTEHPIIIKSVILKLGSGISDSLREKIIAYAVKAIRGRAFSFCIRFRSKENSSFVLGLLSVKMAVHFNSYNLVTFLASYQGLRTFLSEGHINY